MHYVMPVSFSLRDSVLVHLRSTMSLRDSYWSFNRPLQTLLLPCTPYKDSLQYTVKEEKWGSTAEVILTE
jgi:hypothetical protein